MIKYSKSLLLIIFLNILYSCIYAESEHTLEAIPTNHTMGKAIIAYTKNTSIYDIDFYNMAKQFDLIDDRGKNTDFRYVLLNMQIGSDWYKGSGTILYNDGRDILVLTALHNVENPSVGVTNKIEVYSDSKYTTQLKIAEVINIVNDYIRIPFKDIALFIARLEPGMKSIVPLDASLFDIKKLESISYPGSYYKVEAILNQYPSQVDEYFRIKGDVYYDLDKLSGTMIGYSNIPTLAGASGSSVIYNDYNCWFKIWCNTNPEEFIVGVHVRSGNIDKSISPPITHSGREIMVENNEFELLSQKEIKSLSSKNKDLDNLLKLFIGGQKHEEL